MIVVFAAALAFASTNLDNLAMFLALATTMGVRRVATAFVLTQAIVIVAAFAVGAAADNLPASWLGFLGLIPIGLGLEELWRNFRSKGDTEAVPRAKSRDSLGALMLTFTGMSADTFVLTTVLLADSAERFDLLVLAGAAIAAVGICLVGVVTTRVAAKGVPILRRLDRIKPFIMIAVGVYILADTVTDIV